jgi:hypothetical protein
MNNMAGMLLEQTCWKFCANLKIHNGPQQQSFIKFVSDLRQIFGFLH